MQSDLLKYLIKEAIEGSTSDVARDCRAYLRLYKGRRIGVEPTKRQSIPDEWTEAAWERQGRVCGRCGGARCGEKLLLKDAVGDHEKAIILGGAHSPENIIATSEMCNLQKGGRELFADCKKLGQTALERVKLRNNPAKRAWPKRKLGSKKNSIDRTGNPY